jgi:hypothetical protein
MEQQQQQVDITKMDESALWKLAFEQQKQLTNLLAQLQQTQGNIAAIEAEIGKRKETVTKSADDNGVPA